MPTTTVCLSPSFVMKICKALSSRLARQNRKGRRRSCREELFRQGSPEAAQSRSENAEDGAS